MTDIHHLEVAKDKIEALEIGADIKRQIQIHLSEIRSSILERERDIKDLTARANVYKEVCDKLIDKFICRGHGDW